VAEIGMRNLIDLELLSSGFQFVELGRHVGEFILQLWGTINEVTTRAQEGLVAAGGNVEVRSHISQTEEAVECRVGPLEQAEVKDRTSRVE
jgi:hypothetical protein